MAKSALSSMFIGSSIVVGPYTVATQVPTSSVIKATGEGVGFGERCLFDERICALLKETKFEQDKETNNSEDNGGGGGNGGSDIESKIKKRVNQQWKSFLAKKDNDYCGFGFLMPHPESGATSTSNQQSINVNNLEKCYEFLVNGEKGKKK